MTRHDMVTGTLFRFWQIQRKTLPRHSEAGTSTALSGQSFSPELVPMQVLSRPVPWLQSCGKPLQVRGFSAGFLIRPYRA